METDSTSLPALTREALHPEEKGTPASTFVPQFMQYVALSPPVLRAYAHLSQELIS